MKRSLSFPLPAIAILSLVLLLAILLSVMTYRNLRWEQQQMQMALSREGLTLIRTIEAGARTGMMAMMWRGSETQTLLEEASKQPEVAFIGLIDRAGIVTAHTDTTQINRKFTGVLPAMDDQGIRRGLVETPEGESFFVVARTFRPVQNSRSMEMPMHSMGWNGMSERWMSGRWMSRGMESSDPPFQTIVVGLKTDAYDDARATDIKNTMFIAGVLLLVGSAGIYLVFALQRHAIMQRAFGRLSDYTSHLIRGMPSGLISLDCEGRIVTINPAAEQILHRVGAQMRGKPYRELWECPLLETLLTGEQTSLDQEVECSLHDGQQVVLGLSATLMRDDTGQVTGVICLFRDLTELKLLQIQVQRADRLAAVGQFAAGIAHEIRNPLNTLKGFAQYLHTKMPPEAEQRKYTQFMVQESERLNRLITDLLDFARPMQLNLAEVDINQVLEETLSLMQRDADALGIQLTRNLAPRLPSISADPEKLKQVFLNLFLNALQAMPEGGTIEIATREQQGQIETLIRDSGSGIAPQDLPHIFDPFFSRKKDGTGLGLAMVHRIVEAHEGQISVESAPGEGTQFALRFRPDGGGTPQKVGIEAHVEARETPDRR